jgi:hypothetical protein
MAIQSSVTVELWVALKDFQSGSIHGSIYLRDVWPGGSNLIGQAGFSYAGQSNFAMSSSQVGVGNYTVAPGHSLELMVIVPNSSSDDVWVAYDTVAYKSRFIVN